MLSYIVPSISKCPNLKVNYATVNTLFPNNNVYSFSNSSYVLTVLNQVNEKNNGVYHLNFEYTLMNVAPVYLYYEYNYTQTISFTLYLPKCIVKIKAPSPPIY